MDTTRGLAGDQVVVEVGLRKVEELLVIHISVYLDFIFFLFIHLFVFVFVYFEGGEGAFFQGGNVERVFYSVWLGGQQRPFFISMLRRFHH